MLSENTLTSRPTDIIAGFPVRPGFFELNGATSPFQRSSTLPHIPVTVHPASFFFSTPEKMDPFPQFLPFPNACRIGDVYSMIVMGLDIEDWNTATASTVLMNRKKAISSIRQKFFLILMPKPLPVSANGDSRRLEAITPVWYAILSTGKTCLSPPVRSVT